MSVLAISALTCTCAPAQGSGPPQNPIASLSSAIREVTQKVSPSVVQITVVGYSGSHDSDGSPAYEVSLQRSSGSGVIVDPEGYILTNAHVIEGAVSIKVSRTAPHRPQSALVPAETVPARLIGTDTDSDLALIKIDGRQCEAISFGDSDRVAQGDVVLTVGSPFLLRNSVSMGVVSAPARSVGDDDPVLYIQTDAPINPGESGGALVNAEGRLVGINTFIMSRSGGNEGIGFAIPSETAKTVYEQLRQSGSVSRGTVGLFLQNISPPLAKGLDLPLERGALVSDVLPEGPADIAGFKRRDIIVGFNNFPVESARQFNSLLFRTRAGEEVAIDLRRGQQELRLEVPVSERSVSARALSSMVTPAKNLIDRLGIFCVELSGKTADLLPDLRRQYGLVVAARSPQGPGQFMDLRAGDVIHTLNNLPIASLDVFRQKIDQFKQGDAVALQIERDGQFQYVAFEIQ